MSVPDEDVQQLVVCTKFDIYVCITITGSISLLVTLADFGYPV